MSKSNRIDELRARLRWPSTHVQSVVFRVAAEVSLVKRRLQRRLPNSITAASQANRGAPGRPLSSCFGLLHTQALRVIDEEGAIRVDNLARVLRIPVSEAQEVIHLLASLGLVGTRSMLAGEPQPWVWLRSGGREALTRNRRCFLSLGRLVRQATAAIRALLPGGATCPASSSS